MALAVEAVAFCAPCAKASEPTTGTVEAVNLSHPTEYEEEDNVHVALRAPSGQRIRSFVVEARHPGYEIGEDHTAPGRFPPPADNAYPFESPGIYTLHDSGDTLIQGVRQGVFWRAEAMTVRIGSTTMPNIHYLQLHRRIPGTDSRPQVAVIYADGSIRLKPLPKPGRYDQVFGSSLLIGPADDAPRPVADIERLEYDPERDVLEVKYRTGGSAQITIEVANREVMRVSVATDYTHSTFARFRSMFVTEGNADVAYVRWRDGEGVFHTEPILAFKQGRGREFLFFRQVRSRHNTSAPDLWVGNFTLAAE